MSGAAKQVSSRVRIWKYIYGIFVPLILLPLPLVAQSSESRCGYVILVMACYWVVEPIPVAATSLLPVVLFPLLGVLTTNEASREYMNGTNMMFVGGLFMAVAIEECNLHKRIALSVLKSMGAKPMWMMCGFMCTSMFLSMWISNTATAALMVPIIEAVMEEMGDKAPREEDMKRISVISVENGARSSVHQCKSTDSNTSSQSNNKQGRAHRLQMIGMLRQAMFLSVAYSANIGGTGTLTGTGPNLVVKSVFEKFFPDSNDLSFDRWMMFNVPVMLMCVGCAWCYLFFMYIRKASTIFTAETEKSLQVVIKKKHEELGPLTFQEKAVSVMFLLLVMLWIFRDPHFIKGWGRYFPVRISDATPGIAVPLLLFLIPSDPLHPGRCRPLLEWKTLQHKVPWGVIILLGGGFSVAAASAKSGLSKWLTEQLLSLNISSHLGVLCLLCTMTAIITEFTSNVATANVLLPVVAELAVGMRINPLYLLIPVTISCSFAFMLPVATPPNAIAYEASNMNTLDMVKPGLVMNCACVAIEVLMISTYGKLIFDFDHFPFWAG